MLEGTKEIFEELKSKKHFLQKQFPLVKLLSIRLSHKFWSVCLIIQTRERVFLKHLKAFDVSAFSVVTFVHV